MKACITTVLCVFPFLGSIGSLLAQTPVEKAWNIISVAVKAKEYETRGKAVQALGLTSGDARAQSTAEGAIRDERDEVRAAAADALGQMGARSSLPKLKEMLKDPATEVVFAAANAIFVLGDPDAYRVYYAVLTGQKKSGDPLMESQMKMLKDPKALGRLGFEAGLGFIPFGGVGYKVFRKATGDEVSPVRAAAAVKLTHDPDPKTSKALADMTKDPKWLVRAAVAGVIARRDDPSLLPAVVALLDDENEVVRFNAAAAVMRLASPPARSKPKPAAKK